MTSCTEIQALFSDVVDGELSASGRVRLEDHLAACSGCREEFEAFQASITALQTSGSIEVGEQFETTVKLSVAAEVERDELFRETGMAAPAPAQEVRVVVRTAGWIPFAAAAAVLAAFLAGWWVPSREPPAVPAGPSTDVTELQRDLEALTKEVARLRSTPAVPPETLAERNAEVAVLKRERDELERRLAELPAGAEEELRTEIARLRGQVVRLEGDRAELERKLAIPPPAPSIDRADVEREFMAREKLVEFEGRILSQEQRDQILIQRVVRGRDGATANNEVTRSLEGLEIGVPLSQKGLTLYPILQTAEAAAVEAPRTLHAAFRSGKIEIQDSGDPLQLRIRNGLDEDVLVLAGEIFVGGRTSRVAMEDVVVPKKKTVSLAVACVEPEAWRKGEHMVRESGCFYASPQVRLSVLSGAGQGALWLEVVRRSGRAGDVAAYLSHEEEISKYRERLADLARADARTVGVAVAVGRGVEFVEMYGSHELFLSCYERVLSAAILGALQREKAGTEPSRLPNSVTGVKRLLEDAFTASYESSEGQGRIRFGDRTVGRWFPGGGVPLRIVIYSGEAAEERTVSFTVPAEKLARLLEGYAKQYPTAGTLARTSIVRDLRRIDSPQSVELLRKFLGDPDLAVRREVLEALAERGDAKDERLARELVALMRESRKEPVIFQSVVRTLSTIGSPSAVSEFLKVLDNPADPQASVVVEALPILLLQVRDRKALEGGVKKLIACHVSTQTALKDEAVTAKANVRKEDYQALAGKIQRALETVTGKDFSVPAQYEVWWSDKAAKEAFLKERVGE